MFTYITIPSTIWYHIDHIWELMGTYETLRDYTGPYGILKNHMGTIYVSLFVTEVAHFFVTPLTYSLREGFKN